MIYVLLTLCVIYVILLTRRVIYALLTLLLLTFIEACVAICNVWPKATRYNAEGYIGGATYVDVPTKEEEKREVGGRRRGAPRRRGGDRLPLFFDDNAEEAK